LNQSRKRVDQFSSIDGETIPYVHFTECSVVSCTLGLSAACAAVNAYRPSEKIAIAVAVTYEPGAFNNDGLCSNSGDTLFRRIGAYLAPNNAPPTQPGA
jgi:hypothetical protein